MYGKNVSQLKAEMDVAMGGRAAEEVVFGPEKVTTGLFPMLDFLFLNISAFIGMYTFLILILNMLHILSHPPASEYICVRAPQVHTLFLLPLND